MPVLELDAGKNTTASYVYGANGVVYRRLHLPGNDEYEYHHVNALGSVAIITDDNESVAARYEYDAFGAVRHQWGNSDNTRKFTGKEYDADVKLYYYGARYYDPYIGRFISRDPAGDGINWYVYCRNNPLSLVDPLGLDPIGDPRFVNDTEMEILEMVFGSYNTMFLRDEIRIQETDDPFFVVDGKKRYAYTTQDNVTWVPKDYNPSSPDYTGAIWASVFAHEATHVWQHIAPNGVKKGDDYLYSLANLVRLDFTTEQQATAVQDWVFLMWGFRHCGFTMDGSTQYVFENNTTYRVIRILALLPSPFNNIFHTDVRSMSFALNVVAGWYNPLLSMLRKPIKPVWLGQNFPNPCD